MVKAGLVLGLFGGSQKYMDNVVSLIDSLPVSLKQKVIREPGREPGIRKERAGF